MVGKVFRAAGIDPDRAHCHALRKGVVTALLLAGNPITAVSKFVHHSNSVVTEQHYDKRTYTQVVDNMVLPLEWERDQHDEENLVGPADRPLADPVARSETGDTTRAAIALYEEIQKNEMLHNQLQVARSLLTVQQLEEWQRRCQSLGYLPE